MARTALGIVLLLGIGNLAASHAGDSQGSPTIRLIVPQGIPSNTVQIIYFMTGPFGGYGGYVTPGDGRSDPEITVAVDGTPAKRVKIIAYAPGCQIESLDIQVQGQIISQQLSCVPLAEKILHGQIAPAPNPQQSSAIEVRYSPAWELQFFGIFDGIVHTFLVATAIPDQHGNFETKLPDFGAQTNRGEGEFQFTLRNSRTRNIMGVLSPAIDARGPHGLKVQASYPQLIRFSFLPR